MDFIQTSNKQVDKFGAGKHGFSAGNPVGGVLATYLSNLWCDGVQQEIINVIEGAGLTPSGAALNQLLSAIGILGRGRLIGLRIITSTQIYTPTPGTNSVRVTPVGGGGGGAGGGATGAGQCSAGAGGGGGGWAIKRLITGFSGVTVSIGIGGAGGVIAAGNAGGTTSFGALVSATGGGGGSFGAAASNSTVAINGFGIPGSGAGGDINCSGGVGGYAVYTLAPTSGGGGLSYGGAGAGWVTGGYLSGNNAFGFGCGGSGGASAASQGGTTGGTGAQGVCIIEEYA